MNGKIYGMAVMLAVAFILSSTVAIAGTMDEGDSYEDEFTAVLMNVPPTIDGEIAINEWGNGNETYVDIEYTVEDSVNYTNSSVIIYFGNDADYFYFAFDFGYMTNANDTEAVTIVWAIDVDTDDDFDANVGDEPWQMTMGNQTVSMVGFSNANALWAIGWGESENFEYDHYMAEFAIPMHVFGGVEDIGFAMMARVDSTWNETVNYPIVGGEVLDNILTTPLDASDWAIITFAEVPVDEDETSMAVYYGLIMIGIGVIISVFLIVAYRETILRWIGDGREKILLGVMGLGVALGILGILQILYDWIGIVLGAI